MGQAMDRDGNVLGEASGTTKREVFDELTKNHPDADEIRIKTLSEKVANEQHQAASRAAQKPSVGRIVLYLSAESDPGRNDTIQVPAIITRVSSETVVNLKVLNDGPTDFWKTSVKQGDERGQWSWPPRV